MSAQSPPKRPRLSLQIKALSTGPSIRTSRTLAAVVNPRSPTSFNTLSNVYSTAIDRSAATPVAVAAPEPLTAVPTGIAKRLPKLPRLLMPDDTAPDHRTHTPYVTTQFPETPVTAHPLSPSAAAMAGPDMAFPSTIMTATPPLSAGPVDPGTAHVFCFSPDGTADRHRDFFDSMHAIAASNAAAGDSHFSRSRSSSEEVQTAIDTSRSIDAIVEALVTAPPEHKEEAIPVSAPSAPSSFASTRASRRRAAHLVGRQLPPYQHPRSLHSILRNSPLPPHSARSPVSPRRQSQRLLERASRHVMYHSPLTQTITTNTYTRSHIDLLCEETAVPEAVGADGADIVETEADMATEPETRDGGATPGPFEEMRRRMAGLDASSPAASPITPTPGASTGAGVRKQRRQAASSRRDKKRRWVWTLGQDDEDGDVPEEHLSGAIAALRAAQAAERAAEQKRTEEKARKQAEAEKQAETDVEMQDTEAPPAEAEAGRPQAGRKRKSTPVPYDFDDDRGDGETQTPTVELGLHLQGAWMQAATAAAERVPV